MRNINNIIAICLLSLLSGIALQAQNHWTPNSDPYEDYMTITGYVVMNGFEVESDQYEVGCFIDGDCRGAYRLAQVAYPGHSHPCFLSIWGNSADNGKAITLKLYDHGNGEEYEIEQKPLYQYGEGIGVDDPCRFTLATLSLHSITVLTVPDGKVEADRTEAFKDETITLSIAPDQGRELESISVYKHGEASTTVPLSGEGNTRTFVMPDYSVNVSASFKKTQATLDAEAVAGAKAIIESASYNLTQAEANSIEAIKNRLFDRINQLPAVTGITVAASDITIGNFMAAIGGSEANASGTNGSFDFTVALRKGAAVDTATKPGNTITATPFAFAIAVTETTNGSVVSDKANAVEGTIITLTITPALGYELETISAHKTGEQSVVVSLGGEGSNRTFAMPTHHVSVNASFKKTQATLDFETVAAAKAAAEAASYDLTQTEGNAVEEVKTRLMGRINTLLSGTGITVSASDIVITNLTAAIAGTEGNPSGTNGSFDFTVTLSKGAAVDTATKPGNTITATPFAFTIEVNDTINGSVFSDKANAVEGTIITLTITPASGYELETISAYKTGEQSVVVSLGGEGSNRAFAMPVHHVSVSAVFKKTQATLDTEAVVAAIALVENASYSLAQAEGNTIEAIKDWLANQINQLLSGTGVTVSTSDIAISNFTAAISGDEDNASGTNGAFDFAVTLTKGAATDTAGKEHNCITASPFAFAINIGSLTNGTIVSDKETATVGTIITLTITPALGYELETISAHKTGEQSVVVSLFGEGSNRTFAMPAHHVSLSAAFKKRQATLDAEVIAAAKALVEEASYDLLQAEGNTTEAIESWLVNRFYLITSQAGTGISVGNITITDFVEAVAGDEDNPSGSNGAFGFTVTLSKGDCTDNATKQGNTIFATTHNPPALYLVEIETPANGVVVSDRESAPEGMGITLVVVPVAGYELETLSAHKTDDASVEVPLDGGDFIRTFVMPAYDVSINASFKKTQAMLDAEAVASAKTSIEEVAATHGSFTLRQEEGNTEEDIKTWLAAQINPLIEETGVEISTANIMLSNFNAATAGSEGDISGTDGSFSFVVSLSKGQSADITKLLDGTITAKTYAVKLADVSAGSLWAVVVEGGVQIAGLTPGSTLCVYNLRGRLVAEEPIRSDRQFITLTHRGVYIIVASGQRTKIVF